MSDHVSHLNAESFDAEILSGDRPALVDFSASWCGPCRQLEPVIDELADEYAGTVTVAKVDLDESQEIAMKYGVQAVPTLLFFRDGEVVDRIIGVRPKGEIVEKMDALATTLA